MSIDNNEDSPLSESRLNALRSGLSPGASLEDRTIARLRVAGVLPRTKSSLVQRWALRAAAASFFFGAGFHLASSRNQQSTLLTPDQRIAVAAHEYIRAIGAAPSDSPQSQAMAMATLRSATFEAYQRFPNDQLGGALNFALGGTSVIAPGTPGREGLSVWY